MDCPFCKYPVEDGASFCGECGRELPQTPASEPDGTVAVDRDAPSDIAPARDNDDVPASPSNLAGSGIDLPPLSPYSAQPLPQVDLPPLPQVDLPPAPQLYPPPLSLDKESGSGSLTQSKPEDGNPFTVELDTMLSLQEEVGNSLRVLLAPVSAAGALSDVSMSISSVDECFQLRTRHRQSIGEPYEFLFFESNLKPGVCVCDISVSYVFEGRRNSCDGTFEVVVLERKDRQSDAQKNLSIVFNPNIVASEAGRVRVEVPECVNRSLAQAAKEAEIDPLKVAENLINLGVRKYRKITMLRSDRVVDLPPPPEEAVRKEIQLDFGYGFGKVQFFTDPIVSIGHTFNGVRQTDVIVDPPDGVEGKQRLPYDKMSRGQCVLRSNGQEVEIVDGRYQSSGMMKPSTNGTYVNGEKVVACGVRGLRDGTIGLGTTCRETTLDVALQTPGDETCRHCRLGEESRDCCCRGGHACTNVVLRRRDGVPLAYVALWSCVDIGCIHKAFSGLEIFRYRHAFAWRHGARRGWIVPGKTIEVSHLRSILVSKVWDESERQSSKSITEKGDTER